MKMGCRWSSAVFAEEKRNNALIQQFMPVFYIPNPEMAPYDMHLVEYTWSEIVSGNTSDTYVQHGLCLFHHLFYARACDICDNLKVIVGYVTFPKQIFLVQTIGMILKCMNKLPLFFERLPDYIRLCHTYGIRGYELGVIGDVLLYSLQKALGEMYDMTTEHAWMFAYSKFLRLTLPHLVKLDFQKKSRRMSVLTNSCFENSESSNTNTM